MVGLTTHGVSCAACAEAEAARPLPPRSSLKDWRTAKLAGVIRGVWRLERTGPIQRYSASSKGQVQLLVEIVRNERSGLRLVKGCHMATGQKLIL